MCSKVAHLSKSSAERHADSLEYTYGERPNVFKAKCKEHPGAYHVGFSGFKRNNMKKKARRRYWAQRRGVG